MKLLLAILLAFACTPFFITLPARAVSTSVVISEFRTRGPNGGNDEFIELANISPEPVSLSGWQISASNSSWPLFVAQRCYCGKEISDE